MISAKGRCFLTGETPGTLFSFRSYTLSIKHRVLLVLMWFLCYSTFHMFSALLNISVSTVEEEIRTFIPILYLKLKSFIIWPFIMHGKVWVTFGRQYMPACLWTGHALSNNVCEYEVNRLTNEKVIRGKRNVNEKCLPLRMPAQLPGRIHQFISRTFLRNILLIKGTSFKYKPVQHFAIKTGLLCVPLLYMFD